MPRNIHFSILLLAPTLLVAQDTTFDSAVKPLLRKHCLKCHGAEAQEAERRFDSLTGLISDDNDLSDYQDILDQLNLAKMPPEDEPQPTIDQRLETVQWLTKQIGSYHKARSDSGGHTVLRRLNSREYRNTVRDLLKLDLTMFDPTTAFPGDQKVHHIDTNGEALVVSGYLMQRYLAAAESCVDRALYPLQQPAVQTWAFEKNFRQQPEIDQVHRKTNKFAWITLYDVPGADKPEGAYAPIHEFRKGVPFDGEYEIRVLAKPLNRTHPYDDEFIGTDQSELLRLAIVAGNHDVGELHLPQPVEPTLAEFELQDTKEWYSATVRLDAGFTPRFTFQNGLMDARNLWGRMVRRYRDRFSGLTSKKPGIVEARFNVIKDGKLPQIHVHKVQIRGPLFDQWPTASQRALLGDDCEEVLKTQSISPARIRERLSIIATRAFRRAVTTEELQRLMTIVTSQQDSGRTDLEAFADATKAVLVSPGFLYHPTLHTGKKLSAAALASRLSYFLWSSTPDAKLAQLAETDELLNPKVLAAQIERMLEDPKSSAFVEGFLDSWLMLRDLGSQPPDRSTFRDYYRFDLGTNMKRETVLFTQHLLTENLSIVNFLDADFTFLNKPLAQHYGVNGPKTREFRKVKLNDDRRGGLLGQASVLTVTANGIDTSPIVRGVWFLENLLGTPPPPPPPDIEPLDPDIRGAKTIRDQLTKHRSNPGCFSCHRKIDPPGFALENFDPIGRWRTNYRRGRKQGAKIDASGELSGNRKFKDVREFRKHLVNQQDQFARAFTNKLLAYATGREVSVVDRPEIDRLLADARTKGNGFRDLLRRIVLSDTFAR